MEKLINKEYLIEHPNEIFVFGDNTERKGHGGAASLRDMPNTYGFITKKYPSYDDEAYYTPEEYEKIFYQEITKLISVIKENPDKKYLISKLGSGLSNKFGIYEKVIQPKLRKLLADLDNVEFLYPPEEDLIYYWWGYVDTNNTMNVFKFTDMKDLYNHRHNSVVKSLHAFVVEAPTKEEAKKLLIEKYSDFLNDIC